MDLLHGARGERLERSEYYADFDRHFWASGASGFWKLERQQDFREPGHDSWEAFARGDWDESLRLLDASEEVRDFCRRVTDSGFVTRRVRIVEEPLSPYVRWEMHALRVRERYGDRVRILRAGQVADLETDGPLPEIFTLGDAVMYRVFCPDGTVDHAIKYTDPELVARCRRQIRDLYEAGRPLAEYFAEHLRQ